MSRTAMIVCVWCMNIAQCRTKRNHVKVRIALREKTTLKTGMDALNDRLFAEEFLIRLNCNLCEFAVWVHLPSWITVAHLNFSASKLESCLNSVGLVFKVAHNVRALRSDDVNLVLRSSYACHVVRCLNHICKSLVLAHSKHAIVYSLHSKYEAMAYALFDNVSCFCAFEIELHCCIRNVIFFLNIGCKYVPVYTYSFLLACRYSKYDNTIARNSVVQLARVE